ncbi:MAG: class I adenylate-forming enzyme family protein [Burkholderiales bacterium]
MNAAELLLGHAALARHGARTALICGEETVSYAQLAESAARSSGALAAMGVRPGDRVLILMRDTPQFAAAWLGAVRAGAVAVALNNKLTEAEYRHILADSSARLALVEDVFAAARPDLTAELAREGRIAIAGEAAGLPAWRDKLRAARASAAFEAHPEAPAFLLYSSGTTGRPKGIVHVHRGFASLGLAFRALGLSEADRIFTTSKFFFAYGLEHGLLGALALGATSIVHPDWPDAEAVIDLVARHRPAAMFSVPTIYRRLLAQPRARLAPFRQVRRFVAGGERLSTQLVGQWRQAVDAELLNLYGMSETFCACMLTPPGTSNGARTGVPFPGVEVRLRDAAGNECAPHEPGVLWVRHPAQASGYANLPAHTREQFSDGWFCSRDVFVRDAEGYYIHQGRSDELLKIAGQWVQPGELEELASLEAAIAEAACVPVADADGLERLALFVTANGDPAAAQQAAVEACERALPRHKRPKWVRAVEELPRTATGKVQRFKLREILERELSGKD